MVKDLVVGNIYRRIGAADISDMYDSTFIYSGISHDKPKASYYNFHSEVSKYQFIDTKSGLIFRFKPEDMYEYKKNDHTDLSEQSILNRWGIALNKGYITTIEYLTLRNTLLL